MCPFYIWVYAIISFPCSFHRPFLFCVICLCWQLVCLATFLKVPENDIFDPYQVSFCWMFFLKWSSWFTWNECLIFCIFVIVFEVKHNSFSTKWTFCHHHHQSLVSCSNYVVYEPFVWKDDVTIIFITLN